MRIAFAGTPAVALPALDALAASDHELVAVITRPDAPAGRGKRLTQSPVGDWAEQRGIGVLKPVHPREPEFHDQLRALELDAVAVVAYGALLPQSVLDLIPGGWINLHFSVLPRWRGAAPVQRAILAGDDITGATTFRIVQELDAGPIFGTVTTPIKQGQTSGDLLDELAHTGAGLMVATMDAIAAGVQPTKQATDGITLAPKLTIEDARIDWTAPAEVVDRQIRGVTPAPGAWSLHEGERFKILQAAPTDTEEALQPGELKASKRELLVGTGTGPMELRMVQPFGKKAMNGADWARGATPVRLT